MPSILFIVDHDRESQVAYRELMTSKISFKPFIIRGKNVKDILKEQGITHVPTLVFKKKQVVGYRNIKTIIDSVENQTRNVLKPRQRSVKRESPEPDEESNEDIEQSKENDEKDSMDDIIARPEDEEIEEEEEEEEEESLEI